MPDFDQSNPPKSMTNPSAAGAAPFPQHVYRTATETDDQHVLVVAWKGRTPIRNVVRVVADEKDKAKAAKEGFKDQPVLTTDDAK